MNKKELGLTNYMIVELLNSLSDDDFYEVMTSLPKETDHTIGETIDMILNEIKPNIEESESND